MLYIHVHVLCMYTCILHIHIYMCLFTQPNTYVLLLQAIFIPLQGFLNSIVYGWSRKEFRRAVSMNERIQYRRRGRDYESLNNQSHATASVMYGGTSGANKGT